jgi:hypothetical protein
MRSSNPGAAALRLRNGSLSEDIPAALVREAIQALPSDMPAAKTLRSWHEGTAVGALEREQLRQVITMLLEHAHGSQQDGSVARIPPHAGGRLVAPSDLDSLAMSALTALALALERFLLLWGLGSEVIVLSRGDGA